MEKGPQGKNMGREGEGGRVSGWVKEGGKGKNMGRESEGGRVCRLGGKRGRR